MEQDVSCGNFDLGLAGGGVIGADLVGCGARGAEHVELTDTLRVGGESDGGGRHRGEGPAPDLAVGGAAPYRGPRAGGGLVFESDGDVLRGGPGAVVKLDVGAANRAGASERNS